MTKRKTYLTGVVLLAMGAVGASSAQAKYVTTFQEEGADVVESGSGTFDPTRFDCALDPDHPDSAKPFLRYLFLERSAGQEPIRELFFGMTGPFGFGPSGGPTVASSTSGDLVGIEGGSSPTLYLPVGYEVGTQLSETSTYLDATFASLGLTPGAYVYSWGSGAHFDTFTINIGVVPPPLPVPEPSTWAMMAIGFASLGYAAFRRKSAAQAIRA